MVTRIAVLLAVSTAALVGSLTSSASIEGSGWCPAVSETGTSSASVTQTCQHPAGFSFQTGTASASADNGSIEASTTFAGFLTYPRGSAYADFLTAMQIATAEAGPLFLTFRVHYTGTVNNHAESNASALSQWTIDGAPLGLFGAPGGEPLGTINEFASYTAPGSFTAGDIFILGGNVSTNAEDYHGFAQLAAELVGIEVRNASGDVVAASVTFVPEPSTAVLALAGLALLGARGHFTRV
jgi:hypothetical protein